jgi:hypothetical protein
MFKPSFLFLSLLLPLATLAALTAGVSCSSPADTVAPPPGPNPCAPDGGRVHAAPPDAGAQVAPDGAGHVTFAVSRYFLGDTERDGTANPSHAWQQYGFDLDGQLSFECDGFDRMCSPRNNAPQRNLGDGDDGIDNGFGKNVLPVFKGVSYDFVDEANQTLATGGPTLLLDLEGLGAGADYAPLTARLYGGAALGGTPAYDGTDAWPVRPEQLMNPLDPGSARIQSGASYVVGNTWVGRFQGDLPIELISFQKHRVRLVVRNPVISMDLDPGRKSATKGTLGGVLVTDVFLAEMRDLAPRLVGAEYCSGATIDSIIAQLMQASDILTDGTQDPAQKCSGISIGLGFEAKRVQLGPVAAPLAPLPPVCPDAGADGGDGG